MQARSSSPTGAVLLIAATVLAAVAPSYFNLKTESPLQQQSAQSLSQAVTLSEFEQIRTGLTIAQVSLLLGRSGEAVSRTEAPEAPIAALYVWQNPDGSRINVAFQNGTVVEKSQSGLR